MIKVCYLGDNLVMLTPRVGESLEVLIKLNKAWFDSVFDRIDPWTENFVASHKFVRVRCYDIPITLWNKDCFSKVVGERTSLVSIDNSTLLWENLEYARLQVRVQKNHNVRLAKGMRINGQEYSILIEEEIPCGCRGRCRCCYDGLGSSDSISSLETYVEESACFVNSCEEEVIGGEAAGEGEQIGGEVSSGGIHEGNTTKGLVIKEPKPMSTECQRVVDKGFTLKERISHKLSEEAAFFSTHFHWSVPASYKPYQVNDLAKLVVEVECSNSLCAPIVALGQKGSPTTHYSNGRNFSLAQEGEGVGEHLPMDRGLSYEKEKRGAGSGARAESLVVR